MIGARTRARELALQALYTRELVEQDPELACASTLADAEVPEAVRDHARELTHGVVAHLVALDASIAGAAENWELARLATIDRNVIRLALYEMLHTSDVPARVAINEAIELGKRFSTAQSGAFINGVLDRIRKEAGLPAGEAPGDDAPIEVETARSILPGAQSGSADATAVDAPAADAERKGAPPARPASPDTPPEND